jgi:hypothetical protein
MRKLGTVLTAAAVAGTAALVALPAGAAQKRAHVRSGVYDGVWSVLIRTQYGPCDASYRYPARIIGGQVLQANNDFSYQITGAVIGSGAIAVRVDTVGQSAVGYGRLNGTTGSGRWSVGNTCSGTWSALRRAAAN